MTLSLFDILASPLLHTPIRVVLTIIAGLIISRVISKSLNIFLENIAAPTIRGHQRARIQTLHSIVNSAVNTCLFIILLLMIAGDLGFNIMPILTGAGIAGLALSLGAQRLVQDLIAGFFIITDNHINVGDNIKIGDNKGKIRQILMRHVVLEDVQGNMIYIPTSEVKQIVVQKN